MNDTSLLDEYSILVSAHSYTFFSVPLTLSVTGEYLLSFEEIDKMKLSVAALILASERILSYDEMKFLADTLSTSLMTLMILVNYQTDDISLLKMGLKLISSSESSIIKYYAAKELFSSPMESYSEEQKIDKWILDQRLPLPEMLELK